MSFILFHLGLVTLWGFAISVYFFGYRLNIRKPWGLTIGIVAGLIVAVLMAMADFLIFWPPMKLPLILGGYGFMLLYSVIALFYTPKAR